MAEIKEPGSALLIIDYYSNFKPVFFVLKSKIRVQMRYFRISSAQNLRPFPLTSASASCQGPQFESETKELHIGLELYSC